MKKLTEIEEPVKQETIAPVEDLQSVLNQYAEAATDAPEPIDNSTPQALPPSPEQNTGPVQWQGNPLYFQTGKKAGQLRPSVTKAKVEFQKDNSPTTVSGEIISGALFMTMIDLLLPLLFVSANNYFSKTKIKVEDLALTDRQKNELEPIAEKVAAQVRLTANPSIVLIFTLAGMYGIKFMNARLSASIKLDAKKEKDAHK